MIVAVIVGLGVIEAALFVWVLWMKASNERRLRMLSDADLNMLERSLPRSPKLVAMVRRERARRARVAS